MLAGNKSRTRNLSVCFIIILSFLYLQNIYTVPAHTTKEEAEIFENADDHCNNPTMEVTIAASDFLSFDREIIEVPMDTCITIWFLNVVEVPHSFVIAPSDGNVNMEPVYMNLENSTAVCGQASSDNADTPGIARFNIKTPNRPGDFSFYCGYPGHHEAGMDGILRVGGKSNTTNKSNLVIVIPLILFFTAVLVVLKVMLKTI